MSFMTARRLTFARELLTGYIAFAAGFSSPLPDLPIQYADFAAWQRDRLQGEVLDKLRRYWLKQLKGLPPLELPIDRPRPAVRTTNAGDASIACRGNWTRPSSG